MTQSTAILLLGVAQEYRISQSSKVLAAGKCIARPIVADRSGKFFVISGVYSPRDLDRLGEIIAVIRTEDPKQTQFHTWSAYSIGRSAGLAYRNILDRARAIEEMQSEHSLVIEVITQHWQQAKRNPVMMSYLKNILVLHACRLLNARTSHRLSAGDLVASSSSLVDSLGRYNPSAKSAQITAANTRLEDQLEFDELSQGSAQYRGELAEFIEQACDEVIATIVSITKTASDEKLGVYLSSIIKQVLVKPYTYAVRSIGDQRGVIHLADEHSRQIVAGAFIAERSLAELDGAISTIRDHPQIFIENLDLVEELVSDLMTEVDLPEYTELQTNINYILNELVDALRRQDIMDIRKIVKSIKNIIRHRDIYMIWPQYDSFGVLHPIYR